LLDISSFQHDLQPLKIGNTSTHLTTMSDDGSITSRRSSIVSTHTSHFPPAATGTQAAPSPSLPSSYPHPPVKLTLTGSTISPISLVGGHRQEPYLARGVVSSPGPGEGQTQFHRVISTIIQHSFTNPDLLEEALESPGSGVTCVGSTHRHFSDGNRGLAVVGEAIMKTVLRDQCYILKIPDGRF